MRTGLLLLLVGMICGACSSDSSASKVTPEDAKKAQAETAKEQEDIMNKGM
ncbi:MAG: hypothetical protein WCK51_07635 [Armatimonadota bacterium]